MECAECEAGANRAAALYIATHPGATPAQVQAALMARAEPGPITGDPDAYPEGIVNVSGL